MVVLVLALGCSTSKPSQPASASLQVPTDTALYATASITKLRKSVVWPRLESMITERIPIEKVRTTCGFDPLKVTESIALSVPAEFYRERMVVYVRGAERSVVDPCVKSLMAAQNHPVTVTEENKLVAYREADTAMFAGWLDAKTVAVTPGDLSAPERLRLLIDKPQPPAAAFTEQASKLATGHTLAFAFMAPAQTDMNAFLSITGVEPEAGRGWLDLDSGLRAELTLQFSSAQQASTVASDIMKRAAAGDASPIGTLLRGVRATANANDVVITVQLDQAGTEQVLTFLSTK